MAVKGYSTSEVARLLGLIASQVRGYVRAGFLSPERGAAGRLAFSFQDLVFLRTARGLLSARVAPRRIRKALRRLREQLPDGRPLAAVRIADGGEPHRRRRRRLAAGSPSRARSSSTSASPTSRRKALPSCAARSAKPRQNGTGVLRRRLVRVGLRARARLAGRGDRGVPPSALARSRASGRAREPRPAPPRGRRRRRGRSRTTRRLSRRGPTTPLRPSTWASPSRTWANARGPARLPESRPHRPGQRRRALQRRVAGREAGPAGRGPASPPDVPKADAAGIRWAGACFLPCPCCVLSSPP